MQCGAAADLGLGGGVVGVALLGGLAWLGVWLQTLGSARSLPADIAAFHARSVDGCVAGRFAQGALEMFRPGVLLALVNPFAFARSDHMRGRKEDKKSEVEAESAWQN